MFTAVNDASLLYMYILVYRLKRSVSVFRVYKCVHVSMRMSRAVLERAEGFGEKENDSGLSSMMDSILHVLEVSYHRVDIDICTIRSVCETICVLAVVALRETPKPDVPQPI